MKPHPRSLFRSASLATLASICITLSGHGASLTWDGNGSTVPNPNGGTGTWNVNSTANWWNGTANVVWPVLGGTNDDAVFGNTAGTVTLGSAITANDLTFNTTGYILSGAQTLTLNGSTPTVTTLSGVTATLGNNTALVVAGAAGLTKTGAGTLTLNGSAVNTFTGGVTISGGILNLDFAYLATPTNLINSGNALTLSGGSLSLVAKSNVTSSQTFNGLTLNSGANSLSAISTGTGAMNVVLGAITRNAGALFNVILPTTGTISATGTLSNGIFGPWATVGTGSSTQYLTLTGSNFAALTGTGAATAANLTDTGGTENYDLADATGTVQASMSANTIRYTGSGGITAPGSTLFSVNGLMNAGTGVWTIGTNALTIGADKDLVVNTANNGITISGVIKDNSGGASSLIKAGPGTLTISAAPTYTGNTTITGGTLSYTAGQYYLGTAATAATMEISGNGKFQQNDGFWFNVGGGTGTATLNVKDSGNLTSQYLRIGSGTNSNGIVNLSGGTIAIGNGNPSYIGYSGAATWNQTGGTATFGNQIYVGYGSSPATVNVSGGSFTQTAGSNLYLGLGSGLATLNLTNTGSVNLQHLQMSWGATTQSVINLDGGTLKIGGVGLDVGSGNGTFNFNGGVLQAASNTSVASTRLTTVVKSGGAIIDTQGYTLTVNSALTAGTGNGGLTKVGAGTLILTAANSYTGTTTVNSGVLTLEGSSANTSAGLTAITGDGVLKLNKSNSVAAISGDLTIQGSASFPKLYTTADNQFASTSVINFTGINHGIWELLGTTQTIAGITGASSAGIIENNQFYSPTNTGTGTIALNGSGTYSYAGFIRDNYSPGGGKIALTKSGGGIQALSGSGIYYTGSTTVNSGTLSLLDAISYNSATTVNSGGTFSLSGSADRAYSNAGATIALNSGGILEDINPSNYTVYAGAVTSSGTTTINLKRTAQTSGIKGFFLDGGLKGSGTVTINVTNAGSAVQFRNNNSTFAGTLIVNGIASSTAFAGSGIGVGGNTTGLQNADITLNGTMELLASGIGSANVASGSFMMGALSGSGVMVGNHTSGGVTTVTLGNTNNAGTFSGAIANGVGNTVHIVKTGSGTQTFSGSNSYSGATTINGGTLQITNLSQIAATSGVGIGASGTLTVTATPTSPWNRSVSGSGIWNLSGTATGYTQITGALNTFTGTLNIGNSIGVYGGGATYYPGAGATINIASGGQLNVGGGGAMTTVAGTINLNGGTGPSWDSTGAALRLLGTSVVSQNLVVTANTTIGCYSGQGGGTYAGSLTLNSGTTLTVTVPAHQTIGGNLLGSGTLTTSNGAFAYRLFLGGSNSGFTGTIRAGASSPIAFTASSAGSAAATFQAGLAGGSQGFFEWASSSSGSVQMGALTDGGYTTGFIQNYNPNNGSTGTFEIGALGTQSTFSGTIRDSYSAGSSKIAITKTGGESLTLSGTNSYSGGTLLSQGQLNINSASAIGSGRLTIAAGTTLDNQSAADITLANSNAQTWNGNFTFQGTRSLNMGNGAVTMAGSTQVNVAANTLTLGGAISGSGGITKTGSGTMVVSGNNTYTGDTVISQGTLRLTASANVPAALKIMPLGDSITYGSGGSNAGYRGPLATLLSAESTGFQFVGSSTLNPGSLPAGRINHDGHPSATIQYIADNLDGFNDENLYHGAAWSNTGGYWLSGGNGTGRSALYPDIVTLMVGTNDVTNMTGAQARLDGLIDKLTTMRPDAKIILADITPRSSYTTEVATYNTYVNAVAAKYLSLGKNVSLLDLNTAFPAGGLTGDGVHPNDTGYNWMANQWNNAILSLYQGTAGGIPSTSNVYIATGATLDVNGTVATIGTLTGEGSVTLGSGGQLTVTSATGSPSTFSGVISGAGNLAVTGTGTQTLSGTNTYTGTTTVNGGRLSIGSTGAINGTSGVFIGAGEFNYNSSTALSQGVSFSGTGGTLSGTGTITPAVVVSAGNIQTGGSSVTAVNTSASLGKQTFSGGITYNQGSIFEWNLTANSESGIGTRGVNYDAIDAASLVTSGSGAIFRVVLDGTQNFSESFWNSTRTWTDIFNTSDNSNLSIATIFDGGFEYGNSTGTFASAPSSQGSFTIDGSSLKWTAVPEPSSALAGLLLGAGLLRRRRKK